MSARASFLVRTIRWYQAITHGRPSGCRYWPSCSEYACQAIETYGAARGLGLAARRLARCHPWGGHGVDPLPDAADLVRPSRGSEHA